MPIRSWVWAIWRAVCEAIVFATKAGGDPEALIKAWIGGAGNSWMLSNLGPKIFEGDFEPGFMVDLAQKDLGLVLDAAREMNVPLFTTPIVNQIFRSVQQTGHGREGTQAYCQNRWSSLPAWRPEARCGRRPRRRECEHDGST